LTGGLRTAFIQSIDRVRCAEPNRRRQQNPGGGRPGAPLARRALPAPAGAASRGRALKAGGLRGGEARGLLRAGCVCAGWTASAHASSESRPQGDVPYIYAYIHIYKYIYFYIYSCLCSNGVFSRKEPSDLPKPGPFSVPPAVSGAPGSLRWHSPRPALCRRAVSSCRVPRAAPLAAARPASVS